jgi:hypothetical protein
MSLRQKYLRILTEIAPVGATSLSLLIGSTTLSVASNQTSGPEKPASTASVSERLAAIREAVSDIAASESSQGERVQLVKNLQSGSKTQQSTKPPTTSATPRAGGGGSGGEMGAPKSRWYNPWNNWHNWRNWGNWFRNW